MSTVTDDDTNLTLYDPKILENTLKDQQLMKAGCQLLYAFTNGTNNSGYSLKNCKQKHPSNLNY